MTIINLTPCANGAYANQTKNGEFKIIPDGWTAVPEELEDSAKAYLPWVTLTAEDGTITAISENAEARIAWENENREEVSENGN